MPHSSGVPGWVGFGLRAICVNREGLGSMETVAVVGVSLLGACVLLWGPFVLLLRGMS